MPAVCVTFDNMGPDDAEPALSVGYPRVLDLLDRLGLRATFFVEGWNGEHVPDRVAELQDRGHEVGLHGWVHERWAGLDRDEAAALLDRGVAALRAAGVEPAGFRAPGGARGPHTAALLAERGFRYDASLADDDGTAPSMLPEGVASIPFSWRHVDGYHYLRPEPRAPDDVASRWLADLDANDNLLVLINHAAITAVHDDRFAALTRVLERVTDAVTLSSFCAQNLRQ